MAEYRWNGIDESGMGQRKYIDDISFCVGGDNYYFDGMLPHHIWGGDEAKEAVQKL